MQWSKNNESIFKQFCFLYHGLRMINVQHFNLDSGQRYRQETGNKIQQYDHVGLWSFVVYQWNLIEYALQFTYQ